MSNADLHNAVPAGLLRRLLAGLYDWLLVLALMMVVSVPVVALLDDAIPSGNAFYQGAMVTVAGVFFVYFWARGGQTLGMRAWRLRLVNAAGTAPTTTEALWRFCCAWIAFLPLGAGFWWSLVDRDKLTWHDRWSQTRLLVLPKQAART